MTSASPHQPVRPSSLTDVRQLRPSHARLLAPDVARGTMLLGIALANVSVYLWGHDASGWSTHPVDGGPLDTWLSAGAMLLIDGHIYPMFAFLFGYGITQFAVSRVARGVDPNRVERMLVRRHAWLLVFGAVHALLLFAGDILGAYALTGFIVAPLLLRASDRTMKRILWIAGGVVAGGMLLTVTFLIIIGAFMSPEVNSVMLGEDSGLDVSAEEWMAGIPGFFPAMMARLVIWVIITPSTVLTLGVPLLVALGGLAARYRWLEGGARRYTLSRVATIGITLGVLGALPVALSHVGVLTLNPLSEIGWLLLSQAVGYAGGVGYVALIGLLCLRVTDQTPKAITAVAAVGKRSLSSYLLQSVIFAPLLSAWGFGLGGVFGTAQAFALATAAWAVSLLLAVLLERRNARGPAERLLRTLTYRHDDQPVRAPSVSAPPRAGQH